MAPQDCLETKPTGLRRTQPGSDAFISQASMSLDQPKTLAWDDAQERRVRLLLLGKGAVLAAPGRAPRAAEMDEPREPRSAARAVASQKCCR
jgi:hypothetical protein